MGSGSPMPAAWEGGIKGIIVEVKVQRRQGTEREKGQHTKNEITLRRLGTAGAENQRG